MKVATLLEQRRQNWSELERLCVTMAGVRRRRVPAETVTRFAALYRAACADLALSDAYQLPPNTVQYLHQLVVRAHNQLYRSQRFDFHSWGRVLMVDVPQRLFRDRCVHLALLLFWTTFIGSAALAYYDPNWSVDTLPAAMREQLEENFKEPLGARPSEANFQMAGFYIQHNTSIGLRCFAWGLLIVPGLYETLTNALVLGAAFGYMGRPEVIEGTHFFEFVVAHGPFELTAIALSAGAGLRLGLGWIRTDGLTRMKSLERAAVRAMPVMGTAMLLFFLAALIEGFVSPTALLYPVKAAIALFCSGLLMFYFVVLGYPGKVD